MTRPRVSLDRTLLVLLLLGCIGLCLRPAALVPDHPFTEDGYYAMNVARNVAQGHGFSVDGVHPTSGFQPLFVCLSVVVFWICGPDNILALRAELLLQACIFLLSALVFARCMSLSLGDNLTKAPGDDRFSERNLLFVLLFLSAQLFVAEFFNGLETGLSILGLLTLWLTMLRFDFEHAAGLWRMGLVLGLCVLIRVDAVFLCAAFALTVPAYLSVNWFVRIRSIGVVALVAFLVSSPWWLYNIIYFHTIMPSGATAQQLFTIDSDRWQKAIEALLVNLLPHSYAWDRILGGWDGVAVRVAALFFGYVFWRWLQKRGSSLRLNEQAQLFLRIILIFSLELFVWYSLSSWASHFYLRYYVPASILGMSLSAVLLAQCFMAIRRFSLWTVRLTSLAALVALVLQIVSFNHRGSPYYHSMLSLVEHTVPQGAYVGSRQSGTLGFFREHVVNLDGKVNSEVLPYQGRVSEYLENHSIEWFCDWPEYATLCLGPQPELNGWYKVAESRFQSKVFVVYHKQYTTR